MNLRHRRPYVRLALRATLWLLMGLWGMVLLAWLGLHWFILPHIDDWRGPLQEQASKALGVPVRIGHVQVQSGGWVPALALQDVRLLDAAGRDALRLERVTSALSPKSLLTLQPRFAQLHIDGATLDVRRDAQGHIHVAGLDMSHPSAPGDTSAMDWFFGQEEFVIRNGRVRWTDEQRAAPPLQLEGVDLVLRNGLRSHALRLDATPPPLWGARFSLRGQFTQPLLARPGDLKRWSGNLYAELPRADVSQLKQHVSLPFELREGDGALRAWVEVALGLPRQVTVDMALHGVVVRLARNLEPLAFAQVQGRIEALRDADGVRVSARNFGFVTGDGLVWPAGQLQFSWRQAQDLNSLETTALPVVGGEFSADRLDLDLMNQTAARLPVGDALRRLLATLSPKGVLQSVSAGWTGSLDAPSTYQLRARMSGLSIAAASAPASAGGNVIGRPGFRNADIDLNANERGGEAKLAMSDGMLTFPGVFEAPDIPLQRLSAQLTWRVVAAKQASELPLVEVKVKDARFANADAQGELNATWSTGAGEGLAKGGRLPGLLDLSARLTQGNAARVARYLPLGVPASVRDYARRAVQSGTVSSASIRVRGDLWEFPFYKAREGEFKISAQAQDVVFSAVPGDAGVDATWPLFTKTSGQIEFDRLSMRLHDVQSHVLGFELRGIAGGIADLTQHPVLVLDGQGRGPAADILRYLDATPIGAWLGHGLKPASATGAADLKLGLTIPVADPARTQVRGSVTFAGGDLRIRPDMPTLAALRGRLDFTEHGFGLAGAAARVWGSDVAVDGGIQPDGSLRFTGQGAISAEALRRASEFPALARAANLMRGQSNYRLQLGLLKGHSEIAVSSNMVGMAVDLPPPLRKSAETTWQLRYQTTLLPALTANPSMQRDQLVFELGSAIQASFVRDVSGDWPRVLRGGIGIFDAVPTPPNGVHANLNLAKISLDEWQPALLAMGGDAAGEAVQGGYAPQTMALRVRELVAGSRHLSQVVASISQQQTAAETVWRATVHADQLGGNLEYRAAHDATHAGRFMARLERLSLPPADAAAVEELIDSVPTTVPALDIVVDNLELRGKKLGRVEVQAVNSGASPRGGAREWRLSKFNMTTPEAQLNATGVWASHAGARRMDLDFKLSLADSGAFAERLGAGQALRGGKGQIHGQLRWAGSPLGLDYPSLEGQVQVGLDAGQFLNAEPGAARLLGVLSLQSLPRRLLLDFRDVFQEGFAFDNVTGDFSIAKGLASTRNLRMRGLQATVFIDGTANLLQETQDLQVLIVPEINAGAASLAYAAVNPLVGLGTFVAQVMLRRPLMMAGTREFHVSGAWTQPKVDRIERQADAPLPQDDAASAPAADSPKKESPP